VDPDTHVLGGKALIMPLGAKLEIPEIYFSTGGGATNTAVTFAKQGFRTATICVVGDDVSGKTIISELGDAGVDTSLVRVKKNLPTAYSILLELESGERTVLVYRGVAETLSHTDIPLSKIKTKWFYLSSVAGDLSLLKEIIDFVKKHKMQIAYNPGGRELKQYRKLTPLLKDISVLIANREEAVLITGVPHKDEKRIFKVWDEMSPGINIMTDARDGVMVSDGKFLYQAGIYKEQKTVDRTGAGDAFGSGFVAGFMRHPEDITYAIKLGSANATSKIEGLGAKFGLLSRREFENSKRWRNLKIVKTTL